MTSHSPTPNHSGSEPLDHGTEAPDPTILEQLRALIPKRRCTPAEGRRVAELQAARLLCAVRKRDRNMLGIEARHIAAMPGIRVVYETISVSGLSFWNGRSWIIAVSASEPPTRQRFTLLHEFKHIIDHGATNRLYQSTRSSEQDNPAAEAAADYFAGCALVPTIDLKRFWAVGIQRPRDVADYFDVSEACAKVRLDQTGLSRKTDPEVTYTRARCSWPISTRRDCVQRLQICYSTRRSAA